MANVNFNTTWTGQTGTTILSAITTENKSVVDRVIRIELEDTNNAGITGFTEITQSGVSNDTPIFQYVDKSKSGVTTIYTDWKGGSRDITVLDNVYAYKNTGSTTSGVFDSFPLITTPSSAATVLGQISLSDYTNTATTGTGGTLVYGADTGATTLVSKTLTIIRQKKPTVTGVTQNVKVASTGGSFTISNISSNYDGNNYSVTYTTGGTVPSYATVSNIVNKNLTVTFQPNNGVTERGVTISVSAVPLYSGTVPNNTVYDDLTPVSTSFTITQEAGLLRIVSSPTYIAAAGTDARLTVTSSAKYKIKSVTISTPKNGWFSLEDSTHTQIAGPNFDPD